jgi:hypothetical protein
MQPPAPLGIDVGGLQTPQLLLAAVGTQAPPAGGGGGGTQAPFNITLGATQPAAPVATGAMHPPAPLGTIGAIQETGVIQPVAVGIIGGAQAAVTALVTVLYWLAAALLAAVQVASQTPPTALPHQLFAAVGVQVVVDGAIPVPQKLFAGVGAVQAG